MCVCCLCVCVVCVLTMLLDMLAFSRSECEVTELLLFVAMQHNVIGCDLAFLDMTAIHVI